MTNKDIAQTIITLVGGKQNIISIASCMTRFRVDVADTSMVNVVEIKKLDPTQGCVISDNQVQTILGPGKAAKVCEEASTILGKEFTLLDGEALKKELKQKNQTPFKTVLKKISSVFIPILPAIIACGLVMGLNNIFMKVSPDYAATSFGLLVGAMGNAAYAVLPIFVGISTAKTFGGSPYLGGTLASLMTLPALAQITLFERTLVPGRGGIIAVLFVVIFSCWIEKKLHKVVPDAFDIFITPLLTIIIAGFAAILVLQPFGGMISDMLTNGVKFSLDKGGAATGSLLGIMWLPSVMTGLHHSITPLHAELLESIGNTPLLPIFAMVGPGQIGAVLYVYSKTKSANLKRVILSGIPVQIMGIGEPLIYGVTLPLLKPFIAACLSAGIGGALCVMLHLHSVGMGVSGLPLAMMLNEPFIYIGIMILVGICSFIITKILGFEDVVD